MRKTKLYKRQWAVNWICSHTKSRQFSKFIRLCQEVSQGKTNSKTMNEYLDQVYASKH